MKTTLFLILSLFFTVSCGSFSQKANPKKLKSIEKIIKKISFSKMTKIRSSKKMLRKLKKGQWVATVTTDTKTYNKTLIIRKIVAANKKSMTIEIETYSSTSKDPSLPMVVQQVINNYPLTFSVDGKMNFNQIFSNFEIASMKVKDGNNKVQDMTGMTSSPLSKIGMQAMVNRIKLGPATKMKCLTRYIQSARCYKVPFTAGVLGFNIKGFYDQNSNIPIIGYISSQSANQKEVVVAYGFKGRKTIIK